ncbi:splicing factor YJU2-like [Diadema antillarum]|uniref:splicing factor YJU2-like n=1 Tax=Diadema antillarum TaxID=105358 RepID=UPI003A8B72C5
MSERKVLNKYYPPDFDPSKIPKLRLARERQYTVRIMAPFNMQCKVCGEYIYKGKKFNAKTENIHDENYLGLRKYRFYIRCPKCIGEVVFKTDPENEDYTLEQGAVRLFEAAKLYREAEEKEKRQAEEDAQNPMKVLENRTKDSKLEMEVMENLEELREMNMRKAVINYEEILRQGAELEAQRLREQEEEDEAEIRRIFGKGDEDGIIIKRLSDDEDGEEATTSVNPPPASGALKRPTDFLTEDMPSPSGAKKQKLLDAPSSSASTSSSSSSTSKTSSKTFLSGLVKVNKGTTGKQSGPTASATSGSQSQMAAGAEKAGVEVNGSTQNLTDGTEESSKRSTDGKSVSDQERDVPEEKDSQQTAADDEEDTLAKSIQEGLSKQKVETKKSPREKSSGLSLLGGYDFSDSDVSSSDSDT